MLQRIPRMPAGHGSWRLRGLICPSHKGVLIAIDKNRIRIEKTAYLRLTVARMLQDAKKNLPRGYNFIIRDAWRPGFVQAKIYYEFIRKSFWGFVWY